MSWRFRSVRRWRRRVSLRFALLAAAEREEARHYVARKREFMFKAILKCESERGEALADVELGATDTRDEASRLSRSWMEAHAGIKTPQGIRIVVRRTEIIPVVVENVMEKLGLDAPRFCAFEDCTDGPMDDSCFCEAHSIEDAAVLSAVHQAAGGDGKGCS